MMPTLNDVKTGQTVQIKAIASPEVAIQALRMGISAGERVICVARIPAGPVVIQRGGMEVAIGQELCQQIEVEYS